MLVQVDVANMFSTGLVRFATDGGTYVCQPAGGGHSPSGLSVPVEDVDLSLAYLMPQRYSIMQLRSCSKSHTPLAVGKLGRLPARMHGTGDVCTDVLRRRLGVLQKCSGAFGHLDWFFNRALHGVRVLPKPQEV